MPEWIAVGLAVVPRRWWGRFKAIASFERSALSLALRIVASEWRHGPRSNAPTAARRVVMWHAQVLWLYFTDPGQLGLGTAR